MAPRRHLGNECEKERYLFRSVYQLPCAHSASTRSSPQHWSGAAKGAGTTGGVPMWSDRGPRRVPRRFALQDNHRCSDPSSLFSERFEF